MPAKLFGRAVGKTAAETSDLCRTLQQDGMTPPFEEIAASGIDRCIRYGDTAIDVKFNQSLNYDRHMKECIGPSGRLINFDPAPRYLDTLRKTGATSGDHDCERREITSTLDAELPDLASLAFIRIDVNGREIAVLEGGDALIAKTRPIVLVACTADHESSSVVGEADKLHKWAANKCYRISDLWGNIVRSKEEWLHLSAISSGYYFLVPYEIAYWWPLAFNE